MVVEDVLRDQKLEPANGMLHRLITLIEAHLNKHKIKLENTVLERQQPWFLELIDSIDHAIIDLVPEGTSSDQITKCIDELLDRTLAKHQSESESFKKCLHAVFRVRSNNLQQTIPRDSWPILKKSGASPRLWNLINTAALLDLPIWQNLEYPADREWRDGIIVPLLAFPTAGITNPVALITQVIDGWLAGSTYAEIAAETKSEVGLILTLICDDIGYHLQDLVAKNCQLAVAKHGEDGVSEIAQAWPSLLQYGLGTLQQLDLFERGASDRLGVWGIQRHLDEEGVDLRSRDLVSYLRKNGDAVKNVLAYDKRVPRMCAERICAELKIR
jgi:hypothetical protein